MRKSEIKKVLRELDRIPMPKSEYEVKEKRIKSPLARRNIIIAAAALVSLVMLFGCAAEIKEYNDAVEFFEENSLWAEDLSIWEIKKVYRDITTKRFSYDKTAVVIKNSVPGGMAVSDEPAPEELNSAWEKLVSDAIEGVVYSWEYTDEEYYSEELGRELGPQMIFYKETDGERKWETLIPLRESYVEGYTLTDSGSIAVFGSDGSPYSKVVKHTGFITLLSEESGETLWHYTFSGYELFSLADVLYLEGELVAIGRGELNELVFSRLDLDGRLTYQKTTEIGNRGIWNVAAFGDGYLVLLGGYKQKEELYKVSHDGEIGDSFSYTSEGQEYFITDIMEYEGSMYLSTYAVPKYGDDTQAGRGELTKIFEMLFDGLSLKTDAENYDIGGKIYPSYGIDHLLLAKELRNNYTAVLLKCDSESGVPEEFYSVTGSLGGTLSVNEAGMMLWETEYIADAYFSPATSAFTIGGVCCIYEHIFSEDSELLGSTKTERVSDYFR